MTVVSEGPLCLKIHLNKYELKKYFTSYDKIVFNEPSVKKTIETLFNAAICSLTFETNGRRIIELFPTASGGCIFKFTTEPLPNTTYNSSLQLKAKRLRNKAKNNTIYIFAFANFENLITCLEQVFKNNSTNYKSSIYRTNKRYYLYVHIPIFDTKTAIHITEFCDFSARGETVVGLLEEHAYCVAKNNAIEIFKNNFFKAP